MREKAETEMNALTEEQLNAMEEEEKERLERCAAYHDKRYAALCEMRVTLMSAELKGRCGVWLPVLDSYINSILGGECNDDECDDDDECGVVEGVESKRDSEEEVNMGMEHREREVVLGASELVIKTVEELRDLFVKDETGNMRTALSALLRCPNIPGIGSLLKAMRDLDPPEVVADAAESALRTYKMPTGKARAAKWLNGEGHVANVIAREREEGEKVKEREERQEKELQSRKVRLEVAEKKRSEYEEKMKGLEEQMSVLECRMDELEKSVLVKEREVDLAAVELDVLGNTVEWCACHEKHTTLVAYFNTTATKQHKKHIECDKLHSLLHTGAPLALVRAELPAEATVKVERKVIVSKEVRAAVEEENARRKGQKGRASPSGQQKCEKRARVCGVGGKKARYAAMTQHNRDLYDSQQPNFDALFYPPITAHTTTRKPPKTYCKCRKPLTDATSPSFKCYCCDTWFHYHCLQEEGYKLPTPLECEEDNIIIPCPKCIAIHKLTIRSEQ